MNKVKNRKKPFTYDGGMYSTADESAYANRGVRYTRESATQSVTPRDCYGDSLYYPRGNDGYLQKNVDRAGYSNGIQPYGNNNVHYNTVAPQTHYNNVVRHGIHHAPVLPARGAYPAGNAYGTPYEDGGYSYAPPSVREHNSVREGYTVETVNAPSYGTACGRGYTNAFDEQYMGGVSDKVKRERSVLSKRAWTLVGVVIAITIVIAAMLILNVIYSETADAAQTGAEEPTFIVGEEYQNVIKETGEELTLVPTVVPQKEQSKNNFFDEFCDFIGKIFG